MYWLYVKVVSSYEVDHYGIFSQWRFNLNRALSHKLDNNNNNNNHYGMGGLIVAHSVPAAVRIQDQDCTVTSLREIQTEKTITGFFPLDSF